MKREILTISLILFVFGAVHAQWPEATSSCKPWTRWWWHGSAVNKEELTRELESFARVGFGGVEITPIYGVQGAERIETEFLSGEWLDLVRHACLEARRLGMQVDIVPGTGWRLGHELVPENERAVEMKLEIEETGGEKHYQAIVELSGERVKRPAPGGSGYTLDMLDREAVQHYLDWFNGIFFEAISAELVRGVFHDSWEYETNWTHDFGSEFEERRGMELAPTLGMFDPNYRNQSMDTIERWRYSYRQTLDELLLENFCDVWNGYAHTKGLLSRNQGHGSIANLLDVYAKADIPETEIFRDGESFLMQKFASSAAHVAGKILISSESYTWLSEHWTSDLKKIKHFTDYLFLCGINHIFYHGTAYSPKEAAWPGWVFYASTQLNDRNPLWNHLPALNEYITRCQSLLQSGKPYTDAYLYWPIADLYAKTPGKKIRQNVDGRNWFEGSATEETARELWNMGVHFDFISDRQLNELSRSGKTPPTIIIPPLDYIPLETFESLKRLALKGVSILSIGSPGAWKVPDAVDHLELQQDFDELIRDSLQEQLIEVVTDLRSTRLGSDGWQSAMGLRCIRRVMDDGSHLYFIANRTDQRQAHEIAFGVEASHCLRMDPWTGKTGAIEPGLTGRYELILDPCESTFIRVGGDKLESDWKDVVHKGEIRVLESPWRLSFESVDSDVTESVELMNLDWITRLGNPRLENFAGLLRYEGRFSLSEEDLVGPLALDAGELCSSAQVFINGRLIGTSFCSPHVMEIPTSLVESGENELVVEVATLADNRIRFLDRTGRPWRIFKDINFVNIDYKPFDASDWPVIQYGLKGPVKLVIGK